jgi:hypothetical protein
VLDADEAAVGVTMPEAGGLPFDRAVDVVRIIAAAMPVIGYWATTMNLPGAGDADRTDAAAVTARDRRV